MIVAFNIILEVEEERENLCPNFSPHENLSLGKPLPLLPTKKKNWLDISRFSIFTIQWHERCFIRSKIREGIISESYSQRRKQFVIMSSLWSTPWSSNSSDPSCTRVSPIY